MKWNVWHDIPWGLAIGSFRGGASEATVIEHVMLLKRQILAFEPLNVYYASPEKARRKQCMPGCISSGADHAATELFHAACSKPSTIS